MRSQKQLKNDSKQNPTSWITKTNKHTRIKNEIYYRWWSNTQILVQAKNVLEKVKESTIIKLSKNGLRSDADTVH